MTDASGWLGRLALRFERSAHGTQLSRSLHEGPLRVQRVLYPEGSACPHVYLLHPPGGVVAGDRLHVQVDAGEAAQVLLTTPAAQKLYRSTGKRAEISNLLRVAAGGSVEWLPSETLAFPAAQAESSTRVELALGAGFVGWDIACYGMPARGESFDRGSVLSRFELYRGETPLAIEALELSPREAPDLLSGAYGLRGNPVVGNLYAVPKSAHVDAEWVERVRAALPESGPAACSVSSLGELLVVRALGPNVEVLRSALVRAWQVLRPLVFGREAVLPRVWST